MVMCGCTSRDLVTEGFGLFAVACHALLDGHRIAAEVRHEGLALLGLARDDARLAVVDDEQAHAVRLRPERRERRLHLRARRLHRMANPEGGDVRVGREAPRGAQRGELLAERLGPHGRHVKVVQHRVALLRIGLWLIAGHGMSAEIGEVFEEICL